MIQDCSFRDPYFSSRRIAYALVVCCKRPASQHGCRCDQPVGRILVESRRQLSLCNYQIHIHRNNTADGMIRSMANPFFKIRQQLNAAFSFKYLRFPHSGP